LWILQRFIHRLGELWIPKHFGHGFDAWGWTHLD
jgi:hypothetical protein